MVWRRSLRISLPHWHRSLLGVSVFHIMMNVFGKRKTPQEQLRENNRALQRTMRELDREKQRLENEQVKITNDIRRMAKQNQMETVKIMAKDLVRIRAYITKLVKMRASIQAISLNMQTLKSTAQMSDSMKLVTRTLVQMNRQMKLPALQKTLREFEKESSRMEMKQEMISDVMDDVFDQEGDDEATEAVVQQVLDELGIELSDGLHGLPTMAGTIGGAEGAGNRGEAMPVPAGADPTASAETDELEARLRNLKR
uniref:Charged multivesicular body protein 2a n=2 Tax=Echinococcus granulosus TaxID=6210 RepID=A0A068WA65_ECHGR|nr:charged multivesicular body protein 2a [Echinococcus granulosus]